jgi:hypothetical protein
MRIFVFNEMRGVGYVEVGEMMDICVQETMRSSETVEEQLRHISGSESISGEVSMSDYLLK